MRVFTISHRQPIYYILLRKHPHKTPKLLSNLVDRVDNFFDNDCACILDLFHYDGAKEFRERIDLRDICVLMALKMVNARFRNMDT